MTQWESALAVLYCFKEIGIDEVRFDEVAKIIKRRKFGSWITDNTTLPKSIRSAMSGNCPYNDLFKGGSGDGMYSIDNLTLGIRLMDEIEKRNKELIQNFRDDLKITPDEIKRLKLLPETQRAEWVSASALHTEEVTHGIIPASFAGYEEGTKKLRLHAEYERDPRNRAEAIRIHGTKCKCCGFDFNKFYSEEHADFYIEVHHIKSITQTSGVVNPATDLVPLCSNCHSMVHRKPGEIMPVDQLREIMRANGWRPLTSE